MYRDADGGQTAAVRSGGGDTTTTTSGANSAAFQSYIKEIIDEGGFIDKANEEYDENDNGGGVDANEFGEDFINDFVDQTGVHDYIDDMIPKSDKKGVGGAIDNIGRNAARNAAHGAVNKAVNSVGGGKHNAAVAASKNKAGQDMPFDTVFIKKYYRRIRTHALLAPLFDQLNEMVAPYLIAGVTTPTMGWDHALICLKKPKYATFRYKLDAIIELILLDDGVVSTLVSPVMGIIDGILHVQPIKQVGDLIVKMCKKAGIFNDTLMAINNVVMRAKSKGEANKADKAAADLDTKADGASGKEREDLQQQAAKKREEAAAARQADKIQHDMYRADRKAHGLGGGAGGIASSLAAGEGLGKSIKGGIQEGIQDRKDDKDGKNDTIGADDISGAM